MATLLPTGAIVHCPHCGKAQEDLVEDFVVPGCSGPSSVQRHDCNDCYRPFTVGHVGEGTYSVAPKA